MPGPKSGRMYYQGEFGAASPLCSRHVYRNLRVKAEVENIEQLISVTSGKPKRVDTEKTKKTRQISNGSNPSRTREVCNNMTCDTPVECRYACNRAFVLRPWISVDLNPGVFVST